MLIKTEAGWRALEPRAPTLPEPEPAAPDAPNAGEVQEWPDAAGVLVDLDA